eukprot:jgi/Tetstr1/432502/TSEL_021876.t1
MLDDALAAAIEDADAIAAGAAPASSLDGDKHAKGSKHAGLVTASCTDSRTAAGGMKLRQLESLLQDIEPFEEPKIELEQYPTTAHLAAQFLFS